MGGWGKAVFTCPQNEMCVVIGLYSTCEIKSSKQINSRNQEEGFDVGDESIVSSQ